MIEPCKQLNSTIAKHLRYCQYSHYYKPTNAESNQVCNIAAIMCADCIDISCWKLHKKHNMSLIQFYHVNTTQREGKIHMHAPDIRLTLQPTLYTWLVAFTSVDSTHSQLSSEPQASDRARGRRHVVVARGPAEKQSLLQISVSKGKSSIIRSFRATLLSA